MYTCNRCECDCTQGGTVLLKGFSETTTQFSCAESYYSFLFAYTSQQQFVVYLKESTHAEKATINIYQFLFIYHLFLLFSNGACRSLVQNPSWDGSELYLLHWLYDICWHGLPYAGSLHPADRVGFLCSAFPPRFHVRL